MHVPLSSTHVPLAAERLRFRLLRRAASRAGSLADPLPSAQCCSHGRVFCGSHQNFADCIEIVTLPGPPSRPRRDTLGVGPERKHHREP
eukprot:641705-Pyramimonas_sp.AAC.1